jgi:hypothetical protein
MGDAYNKKISISDRREAKKIAQSLGINTDDLSTNLMLGRTARAAGIGTSGKDQRDLFLDLKNDYERAQLKKNSENFAKINRRNDSLQQTNQRTKRASELEIDVKRSKAEISYQFFVWKDGAAGRMTVPVDFGFKTI